MTARPFVTTFYSYKGGVGRTTLAANVAVALARRGKTLLWDLDIEAPGLEHISAIKTSQPITRGYFSAMVEWQKAKCPPKLDKPLLKAWDAALCPVQAQPGLVLLPAAPDARTQVIDYMALDWAAFFGREPQKGLDLFDALLAHWADAGFEFVVIDSRTGVTDLGALLTALVPDVTVLVGNFGVQNVNGLRLAWQALQPATGEMARRVERGLNPLVRELVASPIPNDSKRRAAGNEIWEERFGLRPSEWITIPEDPVLRFSEAIALLEFPQAHPLVAKYEDVAKRILAARERQEEALREDASASALYPELMKPRGGLLRPGERGREAQERGRRFEDQVAHVLQLLRHTVERETLVDGNRIDLIATTSGTLEDVTWFVECKETTVTKEMVERMALWVGQPEARSRNARAMVVGRAFAPAAQKTARNCNVQCFTLPQLEEKLFNFKPYLAQLRASFEQSRLAGCYVSQYVKRNRTSSDDADDSSDKREELLPLAVDWATGKGRPLWVLLGDYGTGKTAFTQRFAYELARRCETEPATPVPLLINLRDYPNATSLETVIDEHLAKSGQERGRAGAILHLLAQGRCVLLLDSFDEMGLAAVGVSVEEQFRQLARPTADARLPAGGRVLVTCREEFFKERKEAEATVSGSGDRLARPGSALEQAAKAFDAQIDALPYFDHEQIREYLEERLGEEQAGEALAKIDSIHGLSDLATRPQLLEIVLESLPDLIAQGKAVSPGVLYYTYVNRWLNRHRPVGARLSVGQVIRLLELLAQTLWARGAAPLHYSELAKIVHECQSVFPQIDPVHVDLELRTAAFLTRSADGLYRFSHRSFLEFFYACRLLRLAQDNDEAGFVEALSETPLRIEVVRFFANLWLGNSNKEHCSIASLLLTRKQVPVAAANLLRFAWWLSQYANDALNQSSLPEQAATIRCVPLTQVLPIIPRQAWLAGVNLVGMHLVGIQLVEATLDDANLDYCDLSGANLDGASLRNAQAHSTRFVRSSCYDLIAENLNATSSTWHQAAVRGANFKNANLRNSDWRKAKISDSLFSGADLSFSLLEAAACPWAKNATLNYASLLSQEHASSVYDIEYTPHWRQLPSSSINAIAFSVSRHLLASAGEDGDIKIWDIKSGKELRRINGSGHSIIDLRFQDNDSLLIAADKKSNLQHWSVSENFKPTFLNFSQKDILALSFSADGTRFAAGGGDGEVFIGNTKSGEEICRIPFEGRILSVAISPDGRMVAAGNFENQIVFWNIEANKKIQQINTPGGAVRCATYSQDNKWVATGRRDGSIQVWDANSGSETMRFKSDCEGVLSINFSKNGKYIITGGVDAGVRFWDSHSGQELYRIENHQDWVQSLSISSDGSLLATGASDGHVYLYDLIHLKTKMAFMGHGGFIYDSVFSVDGSLLMICGDDGVCIFDAHKGILTQRLTNYGAKFRCAAFSPDSLVVAASDIGGNIHVWNRNSGKEIICLSTENEWTSSVSFSPDGSLLACASSGGVRLWSMINGEQMHYFATQHEAAFDVVFFPDAGRIVCSYGDDGVKIFDIKLGCEIYSSQPHEGWIEEIAVAGGNNLAAWANSAGITIFDADLRREIVFLNHRRDATTLAFSEDNLHLYVGYENGQVQLFRIQDEEKIEEQSYYVNDYVGAIFPNIGKILTAGQTLCVYDLGKKSFDTNSKTSSFLYQIRITPTGDPVTLYPDGTHYGEGEALEWLEYAEYGLKPDGTPDPIPTLHRATDVPWLRRGPGKEEKVKRGRKRK